MHGRDAAGLGDTVGGLAGLLQPLCSTHSSLEDSSWLCLYQHIRVRLQARLSADVHHMLRGGVTQVIVGSRTHGSGLGGTLEQVLGSGWSAGWVSSSPALT